MKQVLKDRPVWEIVLYTCIGFVGNVGEKKQWNNKDKQNSPVFNIVCLHLKLKMRSKKRPCENS